MKKIVMSLLVGMFMVSACDLLDENGSGFSEEDIVDGLKTALEVGTDSSVTITSAMNGYYKDAAIKILLPPEAQIIEQNIQYLNQSNVLKALNIDLSNLTENFIKSMNRAAESAAKQATPIFKNSITALSITDGLSILNGQNPAVSGKHIASFDSTAATQYLVSTTKEDLITVYKTPVDNEMGKDLGLGFTANQAWTTLVTNYNSLANKAELALSADAYVNLLSTSEKNILKKFTPITQASIGEYVTGKALDGLFLKVSDQERSIRRDPWKWISSTVGAILTKVFGS